MEPGIYDTSKSGHTVSGVESDPYDTSNSGCKVSVMEPGPLIKIVVDMFMQIIVDLKFVLLKNAYIIKLYNYPCS